MMYKHHVPSTTSLSDNDDDEHSKDAYHDNHAIVVVPAQWSAKLRPAHSPSSPIKQSPISRLPPEILIHVFKHLHSSRDLYASLRVSRTWCQCSVELLWHRPSFSKFETLEKVTRLLLRPDQTFTYGSFIRRLNFLVLAKELNDNTLSILAQCDRLERLTLVNCNRITGKCLANLLPNFPNIVAIDLSGVSNTTDDALVGLASAAKRLQGINVAGCKNISDVGVLALARNCPLLRRVKLSGLEHLTDAPISALARSCPLLLEVDLNHCERITDISVRNIWTHSAHMREMRLSHCPSLTDAAFPAPVRKEQINSYEQPNPFPSSNSAGDELPPLILNRSFEHLRMLDLTACSLVTDDAVEGIITHAPKIRNLVLSKCALLTDRSVENICRLGRNLHYLHLGHAAKITDRSVRTLARSCTRLRYVDFANCILLTDMSVFELSALPKLRRVGLVRVNNLTDEAIYALAERHATLERIHLSYCDQISVMAIHFLLQKLHKLTHLSLTGVPAFRQTELQQFCREPPQDFNSTQQLAFCVYSGKGVSQLRAFLTELFDRITEMNTTDDTEYEDDDSFQEDDTPEPERDGEEEDEFPGRRRFLDTRITRSGASNQQDVRETSVRASTLPSMSAAANVQGAANRLNAQILAASAAQAQVQNARRSRGHGPTTGLHRSLADMLPIVETSNSPPQSDVASNLSAGTNRSNGATFFRTYQEGAISPRDGTPELDFAEIGHGRGTLRRGQEHAPIRRPSAESELPTRSSSAVVPSARTPIAIRTDAPPQSTLEARPGTAVLWPYQEPVSPTEATPSGSDSRGRSVKRSLRNTFTAAEQYASAFLFGRSGRSPTRQDDTSSSAGSGGGASSTGQ